MEIYRLILSGRKRNRTQRHFFNPTEIYSQPQLASKQAKLEEQAKVGILLFIKITKQLDQNQSLIVRQNHTKLLIQLKRYFKIWELRCIGSRPTLEKLLSVIKLY